MSDFSSHYTIAEIAKWPETGFAELPKVQRAFVWKPNQLEDLWDSMLRGYPVGCFVLSPKDDQTVEILDGQQRATAICLGFGHKTFRVKTAENFRVFIDLEEPDTEDARLYYFRVITKSHPWGYQRSNNSKTLDSLARRKAMELFDCDDFLNPDLDKALPFDAGLPIPFHFFLNAAAASESNQFLLSSIKGWHFWEHVTNKWLNTSETAEKRAPKSIDTLQEIEARILDIYAAVKLMLAKLRIPALYLKLDDFGKKQVDEKDELELEGEDAENQNRNDEIENLFIRLNAGGTPLRGEELNYSILKGKIDQSVQLLIENACAGFSQPARFITIAFRLFSQQKISGGKDGISMKIKPKQFQRTISEWLDEFEPFLIGLIKRKSYNGLSLIDYSKSLLEYNKDKGNLIGLPHSIASGIADSAPEIMFLLLYRLMKGDRCIIHSALHRRVLGMITLFYWLGKGEKQKDHAKLLRNIWPAAQHSTTDSFWSSSTVKRAMLQAVLPPIPTFNKRRDRSSLQQFKRYSFQTRTDLFRKYDNTTDYGRFAETMFFNRDIVLYSQREFLADIFDKKLYDLDDTNLPFDWDHISPHKLIHKKQQIPAIIKHWYQSIGNLRAWPYAFNRMDQDTSPARKLDPLNDDWFETATPSDKTIINGKWSEFIGRNQHMIGHLNDLNGKLLEWSGCHKSWLECDVDGDLRKHYKQVVTLIRDRALDILGAWYSDLEIEHLIPAGQAKGFVLFKNELDNRAWHLNPDWIKKKEHEFSITENHFWVSKSPIRVSDSEIYMYISFSKDAEDVIAENLVSFGIYDPKGGSVIKSLGLTDKDLTNDDSDRTHYIQSYFTLISTEKESCQQILTEMSAWIQKARLKSLRPLLLTAFQKSIRVGKSKA